MDKNLKASNSPKVHHMETSMALKPEIAAIDSQAVSLFVQIKKYPKKSLLKR